MTESERPVLQELQPHPKPEAPAPMPQTGAELRGASRWLALSAFVLILWLTREVLTPFVVGALLAYILAPLADQLSERTRIRRRWSGLLVFAIVAAGVVLAGWALTHQVAGMVRAAGTDLQSVVQSVTYQATGGQRVEVFGYSLTPEELSERVVQSLTDRFGSAGDALHAAQKALSLTLETLVVLLTLAYLLIDGHHVGTFLLRFVPYEHRDNVEEVAGEIHRVLGRYLQGQMLLVLLVSVATYLVLTFAFHLPHAALIAIGTGFMEIIPLIGPFVAAGAACAVALTQGGVAEAGLMALTYLIIRQVEDQLVMPFVVGRAVHVHPLITIFAVVAGEHVAGILGALLAVPLAAAAKVVLDYAYPEHRRPAGMARAAH